MVLRTFLAAGCALSFQLTAAYPQTPPPPSGPAGPGGGPPGGSTGGSSPAYPWIFDVALPMPPTAQSSYSQTVNGRTIDYYEVTVEQFQKQIYPNLGPASLAGYNGSSPGPTFYVQRGTETVVRVLNSGSTNSAMHLHGSDTHAPWDGWASDVIEPGSFKDYYYPNSQPARPLWYHDHVDGNTADDVYYGQAGLYIIYDPAEDSLGLPSGKYDVPLTIADKSYQSNGDLTSPDGDNVNFFGDVIHVNGQPWPYLAVEPRKYRLRLYDMSLSRPYDLQFIDINNSSITVQVIASDGGLFGSPVSTNNIIIAMGERYEVVIDFSIFKQQNVTLMNVFSSDELTSFSNTDKIMRFVVSDSVSDSSNNGAVPTTLNADVDWPEKRTTVDHVFRFEHGGEDSWTINGVDFNDINNRVLAKPQQGSVELWELQYAGGPGVHPIHIHLVDFQVISRTGGSRGVEPYEMAGLKDVILLEPGETVQTLAMYGPWNGMYMFHCHNLIHEDSLMLDVFNVTTLQGLGYDVNGTDQFQNPEDPRYTPRPSNAAAFAPAGISSTLAALGALDAYAPASSLLAAESAYYATAVYAGESSTGTTIVASSTDTATTAASESAPTTYPITTPAWTLSTPTTQAGQWPTPPSPQSSGWHSNYGGQSNTWWTNR